MRPAFICLLVATIVVVIFIVSYTVKHTSTQATMVTPATEKAQEQTVSPITNVPTQNVVKTLNLSVRPVLGKPPVTVK